MNGLALASTSAKLAQELDASFWVSVVVLLALAIVGGGVVMWWRGRAFGSTSSDTSATVAETLRELRESGELTQEQYDRAKRRLVERALGEDRPASASRQEPAGAPPESDG